MSSSFSPVGAKIIGMDFVEELSNRANPGPVASLFLNCFTILLSLNTKPFKTYDSLTIVLFWNTKQFES